MGNKTSSPKGGKRGCLCDDGTYSAKCCEGELIQQGIGALDSQSVSDVVNTNQTRVINSTNG